MDTVKADVKSAEAASRIELFVRWVWYVITYIVIAIFGVVMVICFALNWLLILVTGKRNMMLNGWVKKWYVYMAQAVAYQLLLTDERNPLIPEM